MNESQVSYYNDFLASDQVKEVVLQKNHKMALAQIDSLKKFCDHPRLHKLSHCIELGIAQNR